MLSESSLFTANCAPSPNPRTPLALYTPPKPPPPIRISAEKFRVAWASSAWKKTLRLLRGAASILPACATPSTPTWTRAPPATA
eukprot:3935382-Rhodomonas_salina.2